MRTLWTLVVLVPLLCTGGCMDFGGGVARNGTVQKRMPPNIDPNMPAPTQRREEAKPQAAKQIRGQAEFNDVKIDWPPPVVAERPRVKGLVAPVTAQQVTQANVREKAEQLRREIEQDRTY